jgi:hypothetical protein
MACSARIELELTPADLRRLAEVEAGLRQRTPLGEVPYPALAGMLLRRGLEDYEAELRALEPRQTMGSAPRPDRAQPSASLTRPPRANAAAFFCPPYASFRGIDTPRLTLT